MTITAISSESYNQEDELTKQLQYTSEFAKNGKFIPFSQRLTIKELDNHPGSCHILALEYLEKKFAADDVNHNTIYEMSKPGVSYPVIIGDNFINQDLFVKFISNQKINLTNLKLSDLDLPKFATDHIQTPILIQIQNNNSVSPETRNFYYIYGINNDNLTWLDVTSCFSKDGELAGMIEEQLFEWINQDETAKQMILEKISEKYPEHFRNTFSMYAKLKQNINKIGGEFRDDVFIHKNQKPDVNHSLEELIQNMLQSSGGTIISRFDIYNDKGEKIESSGHAFAFSVHSNGVSFFDSNHGEIIFQDKEKFKIWFKDEVSNHTLRHLFVNNDLIKIIEVCPVPITTVAVSEINQKLNEKLTKLKKAREINFLQTFSIQLELFIKSPSKELTENSHNTTIKPR